MLGKRPYVPGELQDGKKQKTLQFKCQRVVEIFSHHDHFYAPNPNFPAKRTDCRLWGQEAPLERVGTKAGVLEAPLATQCLKQGLRPFLPAGDGALGSCSPFQRSLRPPTSQQLPLEGSRCVPPSTIWLPISQKTGWVEPDASPLLSRPNLVTNYPWALLFLFCFINL